MSLNVHLIGPYPPPHGGVSIHISRLRDRLRLDGHICTVWSKHDSKVDGLRKLPRLNLALDEFSKIPDDAIFHFHAKHELAGRLANAGRRVLFTVHNERINILLRRGLTPKTWLLNHRTRKYFRKIEHLVAVSENARDELIHAGFRENQIDVTTAYLRPNSTDAPHPESMRSFNAFRRQFKHLITANASAPKLHNDLDLYGMDLCVDLMHELSSELPDLGMVLVVPDGQGTEYLANLIKMAAKLSVSSRILWLTEQGAYHPIIGKCELFLRPTNTDGFSISIAEAFEYSVPVLASDAVTRPPGCLTFKNRNSEDLKSKTKYMLENLAKFRLIAADSCVKDCYSDVLRLYRSQLLDGSDLSGAS